jgi:hypothetical protein
LGVFFTGIVSVIQGCDAKEAGAALALLFLLQLCSGPAADENGQASVSTITVGNAVIDRASTVGVTPVNSGAVTCVDLNTAIPTDGTLIKFSVFLDSFGAGFFQLIIMRATADPNLFDIIDGGGFQPSSTGLTELDVNIQVQAGDFLGFAALLFGPNEARVDADATGSADTICENDMVYAFGPNKEINDTVFANTVIPIGGVMIPD